MYINAHRVCAANPGYNYITKRVKVPINIQVERWRQLKTVKDKTLLDQLEYGFPLSVDSKGTTIAIKITNNPGVDKKYIPEVTKLMSKLVEQGRLAGPFPTNPLPSTLHVSPLQTVPKSGGDGFRLVHNLSFPDPEEMSINAFIEEGKYLGEEADLTYPAVSELAAMVAAIGPDARIWSVDIRSAYKLLRIDPGDYQYTGMVWNKCLWFDPTCPFGARSSAYNMQRVSTAVCETFMQLHGGVVKNYLDDFASAAAPGKAELHYKQFLELLDYLGLEVAPEKCAPPKSVGTWLGIEVDAKKMQMRIPKSKLKELIDIINSWIYKEGCTLKELQSLHGKLSWASTVVRPGRLFTNRIRNRLAAVKDAQAIRLDDQFRKDVQWWLYILNNHNGVTLIRQPEWTVQDAVLASDATLKGCGAICMESGHFFHAVFPYDILSAEYNINELELLALTVAIKLWGNQLSRRRLVMAVDNLVTKQCVMSGKATSINMQFGMRELWTILDMHSIDLIVVHIPGVENRMPDYLSRWDEPGAYDNFIREAQTLPDLIECKVDEQLFYYDYNT